MRDKRYSIALEWTGQPRPRYVVRFCGDRIEAPGDFATRAGAIVRAACHNAVRLGALTVTEIPATKGGQTR